MVTLGRPQGAQTFPLHPTGWCGASTCAPSLMASSCFHFSSLLWRMCQQSKSVSGLCHWKDCFGLCLSLQLSGDVPLTGQHQGDLQPPSSAFSLRFKGRTEKHHFPRNSSLVTASETPRSDRWMWWQFMDMLVVTAGPLLSAHHTDLKHWQKCLQNRLWFFCFSLVFVWLLFCSGFCWVFFSPM